MTAEEIKNIASLLNISIPLVVAIIVFAICLVNLDKLFLLLAKIQTFFSFCSARARKGAISNSIRGKILHSSKK